MYPLQQYQQNPNASMKMRCNVKVATGGKNYIKDKTCMVSNHYRCDCAECLLLFPKYDIKGPHKYFGQFTAKQYVCACQ